MRLLLLHTALLATIAIAAPASAPDCGRGGYNSWGDDGSTCAEVDTNAGRKGYNGVDEDSSSKRSPDADANRGHSGYNGWMELPHTPTLADDGTAAETHSVDPAI